MDEYVINIIVRDFQGLYIEGKELKFKVDWVGGDILVGNFRKELERVFKKENVHPEYHAEPHKITVIFNVTREPGRNLCQSYLF